MTSFEMTPSISSLVFTWLVLFKSKHLQTSIRQKYGSSFNKTVLISLGYEREEIKSALSKALAVLNDNASAEDILKESLKILSV